MKIFQSRLNDAKNIHPFSAGLGFIYRVAKNIPAAESFRLTQTTSMDFSVVNGEGKYKAAGTSPRYPHFCSSHIESIGLLYDSFVALEARQQDVANQLPKLSSLLPQVS